MQTPMRKRLGLFVGIAAAAAFVAIPTTIGLGTTLASSHREAPMISQDPAADNTDTYAFVSPDRPDSVTFVSCYYPFQEPGGGPNFYRFADDARYVIHVDNNGDARDEVQFEFTFKTTYRNPDTFLYNTGPVESLDSANLNVRQYYTLQRVSDPGTAREVRSIIVQDGQLPPSNIGPKSTPNYEALARASIKSVEGYNVFVGQRDDPFFVDVASIFDLLTIRPGAPGNAGGGADTVGGYNVNCIVLQAPTAFLTSNARQNAADNPAAIIGTWSSAERRASTARSAGASTSTGPWIQVSRLGMPLVNEVVIPLGLKDAFNGLNPTMDAAALSTPSGEIPLVQNPSLAGLLNAIYGIRVPPAPRNDLVAVFLTGVPGLNQPAGVKPAEMLRLNTGIAPTSTSRLGVIGGDLGGFPNGRRLQDDVVDIALRVVAGVLVDGFNVSPNNALGDGVDANDRPFSGVFPYVATPWEGFAQTGQR